MAAHHEHRRREERCHEGRPAGGADAAQSAGYPLLKGRAGTVGEETLRVTPACVYCGERDATTEDHIPPRCLFGLPLPSTLIKVPSCFRCNNGASKDDEYFRMVLSFRHDIDHPDAEVA